MPSDFSRRGFFLAAGAAAATRLYSFQQPPVAPVLTPLKPNDKRATVSLIKGEDRRKNVLESLRAIEDQLVPAIKRKKYVVIKPNNVSTINQLAATHADALRGIIDFLEEKSIKMPVVIAESSAGETMKGFDNFGYVKLPGEYRSRKIELIDLNTEAKYEAIPLLNGDLHVQKCRLAARLLDPDAFIINAAMPKTHNVAVVTLSIKNMTLGAPLRNAPGETPRWNDKRIYHGGVRQTHYNMLVTAQKMAPYFGATVLDGYEGMEGNGPSSGTPVASRAAIASLDLVAADRIAVEIMGVDPSWPGYLNYCHQCGIGQYDLDKIDIRGEKIEAVRKKYALHGDIDRELQWMGPLTELPPKLG